MSGGGVSARDRFPPWLVELGEPHRTEPISVPTPLRVVDVRRALSRESTLLANPAPREGTEPRREVREGAMGQILPQAASELTRTPEYRRWLTPLLSYFDVTWVSSVRAFNADAAVFMLRPEPHTARAFGLEREVLLSYSRYEKFEPRQVQLVSDVMLRIPVRGRVEPVLFIAVSEDADLLEHIGQLTSSDAESKTIVPFNRAELEHMDEWQIRNVFAEHLFSRDLFDITLALVEDTYFFGRQQLVHDLVDRFRQGQNTGLFGLRKTGKTSTIGKIHRTLDGRSDGMQFVLDCQDPAVYQQHWWELLGTVVSTAASCAGIRLKLNQADYESPHRAPDAFASDFHNVVTQAGLPRALLVLDEFEHICPTLSMAHHWEQEFVPFWQTIRAYQNQARDLSVLVVGVNPVMAERPLVGSRDNPIFSIIPRLFMPPFDKAEVREMVRTLGRYMGMRFDEDVYPYLVARYGGHPMLIRLACSWVNRRAVESVGQRPFDVTVASLNATESERDGSLEPYARHILGVLTTWYPLEYEMLEMLCLGHVSDFDELAAQEPEMKEHLLGYGLVSRVDGHSLANQMIADFVRRESRHKKAAKRPESPSAKVSSQLWSGELEQLSESAVHSRTYCQELATLLNIPPIFNDDKVRIGVKLADLRVAPLSTDRRSFEHATSTLQQLFWDGIRQDRRPVIRTEYPNLFDVTNRIRALRHWLQHPDLRDDEVKQIVVAHLQDMLGGYPSAPDDWARLHIALMRDIVASLRDTQQRMFTKGSVKKARH